MGRYTYKQQRFVDEYLIDLNATQAAIRAGYSPRTAKEQASQNLTKLNIQDAIARAMAERSRRTGITQDRVLQELARIAFFNPNDLIDFCTMEIRSDASADDLAAIAYMKKLRKPVGEKGQYEEFEIRFCDKLKALELLCKQLGMFATQQYGENESEIKSGVVFIPAIMEVPHPPEYIETSEAN